MSGNGENGEKIIEYENLELKLMRKDRYETVRDRYNTDSDEIADEIEKAKPTEFLILGVKRGSPFEIHKLKVIDFHDENTLSEVLEKGIDFFKG